MASTAHRLRWTPIVYGGLAALLAAGCGGNPPGESPAPEEERAETGYGSQPPRDITGAVGSVSGATVRNQRVGRVEELFQGRLAGVTVTRQGSGYSVRVRGAGSFFGDGEPLYVIDGTPVISGPAGRALDGINPADVERIDVLKDAGSAAIYGTRAANGVILITTRRP